MHLGAHMAYFIFLHYLLQMSSLLLPLVPKPIWRGKDVTSSVWRVRAEGGNGTCYQLLGTERVPALLLWLKNTLSNVESVATYTPLSQYC
jgi:hypothetical protein